MHTHFYKVDRIFYTGLESCYPTFSTPMQVGFLASVRLGKDRADILTYRATTKNRHQSRLRVPALATVNARRLALFPSSCPRV